MGEVVRLLNTGMVDRVRPRRRIWVEPGRPVIIAPHLALTLEVDRTDDGPMPRVVIRGPRAHFEAALPPACWLDISSWAGLMALPRAAELSETGCTLRLFVEFVAVRESVNFALPHGKSGF